MKKVAIFEGFPLPDEFAKKYSIIQMDEKSAVEDCEDFIIPIDSEMNPLVDMFCFSPTFFGSLQLAFNSDRSKIVASDFCESLLNSSSSGRLQKLHFYLKFEEISIIKLFEAIERNPCEIKGRPWCENLLPFIEIPNHPDIIHSNSDMIFVKDRFPKGSAHYLCIPRKRIDTWWFLTPEDVPLLKKMQSEVETFSKRIDPSSEFVFGFHVIPSMKQLHLHAVNKDFDSPVLTYPQWNAFNTDFLVSVPQVIAELEANGRVEMSKERWENNWALLSLPLECNICKKTFKKLEALKIHYKAELRMLKKCAL